MNYAFMKKLLVIYSGVLILSGYVPDNGYVIINGKVKASPTTNHIVKIKGNKVTVTAK